MLTLKQSKIVPTLLLLLLTFLNSYSSAQSDSKKISLIFPAFASSESYATIGYKIFKDFYLSKGFKVDPTAEHGLIVIPNKVDEKVVVTLLWTNTLPQKIMDFCVNNEVFYIDHPNKDSLSSEGKVVREYITREFMSDYRKIKDFSVALTVILSKNNFENELEEFIIKNL